MQRDVGLIDREEWARILPVIRWRQAGFLVRIRYRTQVAPDNFELGVVASVVIGHFKHPEMKVSDGRKTTTSDKNEWNAVRVLLLS